MVGVGAFLANAANPRSPMFSIQHRSAMKAFSLGRKSSSIVSAPGASQSMSASAHCRSLILASIVSISIVTGFSFAISWQAGAGYQADRPGVCARGEPFDVPADLGVPLRHAVQVAAVMGVQADARNLVR